MQPGGRTELETAATPNLDRIAATAVQGASIPVKPGIAPGSGPGHLGLFGYDPLEFKIGRGALEATGIGFQLQDGDVAIRCNFCTLDADGTISDRRAGRIPTSESAPVAESLRAISIPGIEIFVEPVKEHRFVVVFRGEGLGGEVDDTDPQAVGVPPLDPVARDSASEKTAQVAKEFLRQARDILKDQPKANFHTMRGFAAKPALPTFQDVYGLRAAAIAVYPMYKGLASLVGMDVIGNAASLQEEVEVLKNAWNDYDFFFLHFKYTDSTGEDGNFDAKVEMTEQFDSVFPAVQALGPDVLIVTGDHSTPAYLKSHSWHPVPTMLWSECCRPDPHTA
ncbi:MAG: 2,3-bisphosphoglycerate-independent phosphoglycerate mutase, partial [Planctomycetota bacterium]